jgi:UDP-glucose 4-epimerase
MSLASAARLTVYRRCVRILVTGAAGFIGSNLVDRLLEDDHEVVGIDDLSRGTRANLPDSELGGGREFSFVEADVTNPRFAERVAAAHVEVICHLAAQIDVRLSVQDPIEDARLNVLGTINVLEAARQAGVRKVVFTSSGGSIYGEPKRMPVDETAPVNPLSPYAASKVSGEIYLGMFHALYGLETTALALSNVYGPRQDPYGEAGVVAIFGNALLRGRPGTIYGDGSAVRDYIFVDDVTDAFARAVGDLGDGRRFNIGTGVGTTVRELHTAVAAAAGAADEPVIGEARLGELQAIILNANAARDNLGWMPHTSLADGIAKTLDWIRTGPELRA